jgi:hypothetical protein
MMMDAAVRPVPAAGYDFRRIGRIREKFHEVFGRECHLGDDLLLQRYSLTNDGDLVLFVR